MYTLREVAKASPVPYLAQASSLALLLLDVVQNVRNNKDNLKRLSNEACHLVYTIDKRMEGVRNVGDPLINSLEELKGSLADIVAFAKQRISRNKIMRALLLRSDAAAIEEYRRRLRHSLDVFGIQALISNTDTINNMADDLRFLRSDSKPKPPPPTSPTGPTSRYSFSGSNINFNGTTFNNYDGNSHSISTIDNSQKINVGNTYYYPNAHGTTDYSSITLGGPRINNGGMYDFEYLDKSRRFAVASATPLATSSGVST
ncbi:hypothetical protein VKT23_015336 [Stygiomarasmius scandens]|uniref:NACHT-NTPase and P-loop NTPases N-terminal domain-containing protein n=1 Tax=Marasmiellus scandens TaxID=2682957 RepID=A0ABR1J0V2_9AGAR